MTTGSLLSPFLFFLFFPLSIETGILKAFRESIAEVKKRRVLISGQWSMWVQRLGSKALRHHRRHFLFVLVTVRQTTDIMRSIWWCLRLWAITTGCVLKVITLITEQGHVHSKPDVVQALTEKQYKVKQKEHSRTVVKVLYYYILIAP